MEKELAFVPCDVHPNKEAVKFIMSERGKVVFQCLDCILDMWKATPLDKWKELLVEGYL